jgi:hypothetical protein
MNPCLYPSRYPFRYPCQLTVSPAPAPRPVSGQLVPAGGPGSPPQPGGEPGPPTRERKHALAGVATFGRGFEHRAGVRGPGSGIGCGLGGWL